MERAAFCLDALYRHYSGVPPTCLIKFQSKDGSLQAMVEYMCTAEDLGPSKYALDQVQKIALLDIRLFNADRHAGNILITKKYDLVPIDHGLCLPAFHQLQSARFDWMYWPQAKCPLGPDARRYIDSINVERDANVLRVLGIPEDNITTFRLCSYLLISRVNSGSNLYDIARVFVRDGDQTEPSVFERVLRQSIDTIDKPCHFRTRRDYGDAVVEFATGRNRV